jgi:hypothetical protein
VFALLHPRAPIASPASPSLSLRPQACPLNALHAQAHLPNALRTRTRPLNASRKRTCPPKPVRRRITPSLLGRPSRSCASQSAPIDVCPWLHFCRFPPSTTRLLSSPSIRRRMRVLSEPRMGRVEGSLCKGHAANQIVSITCKRLCKMLKTRNSDSLSFHTHARSFAVSPLFATHTQDTPGVYVPPRNPKSRVLLEAAQLSPAPPDTYSDVSNPRPHHAPLAPSRLLGLISTLFSYTSALFCTFSNLLFHANHLFSCNCALFCHSSPVSPLFASLTQNNGGVWGVRLQNTLPHAFQVTTHWPQLANRGP